MKHTDKPNLFWCRLFALLFGLCLIALPLSWLLARNFLDNTNHENRDLSTFPSFLSTPIEDIPAQTEAFIADRAPYRNQFMSLNAQINWRLFSTIESEAVLAGKDGWLFYKNASDSSPIDDFQGTNLYTQAEMQTIMENLIRLEESLAENGCRLAVLITPSKELVYRRYMPHNIPMVNPTGRIDTLAQYIQNNSNLLFVWPEEELRELSLTQQIYYKHDTHWNEAGGAFTAAVLLDALEMPAPIPAELNYKPGNTPALEDLASLSATWDIFSGDTALAVSNWPNISNVQLVKTDNSGFDVRYASNVANGQKLLMFKDSFGTAMEAPLAAYFEHSSFVHINAFNAQTLKNEMPTVFVIEITQRYANRLLDYLPRLLES